MGYEAGEVKNLAKVEKFVKEKSQGPEAERLHAIWLCISPSYHGGRIFETGDEKLLKMLNKFDQIPLIVVFTMLDNVAKTIRRTERLELGPARKKAQEWVTGLYDREKCPRPFICVSTKPEYVDTLKELTEITMHQLEPPVTSQPGLGEGRSSSFRSRFFKKSKHLLANRTDDQGQNQGQTNNQVRLAAAQMINLPLKIKASIDVGKRKYWKNLLESAFFKGRPLKDCFMTIHRDILVVWNFNSVVDTYMLGDEFINTVSHVVDDISPRDNLDMQNAARNPDIQSNAQKVATVAAAISSFAHPAGLVIGGVTAAVVLATWLWGVYQQTNGILRCMMASIVALVLIMETLFDIQSSIKDGIERLHPTVALKVVQDYQESELKKQIHAEIQTFVGSGLSGALKGRDVVMDKITELIMRYHKGGEGYEMWHEDVASKVQNQKNVQVQPSGAE
ncbi:hypothetical protein CONPUDRAFT_167771 [Coniophora puteana RWD-64-598 SS2]|uniref:G domain-containing protein n=1 Tax=Coniophora puteana (strain RWD-64-598) TaxID=741705 RepID=A0A5M3MFA2_CONPW|nr:uncharacterized protein CONPUDRAFT_167771 [Coniophora puteana RWD-64-598 SS2]EIW77676.1 hypothetical protein CONPUDRAFT_167771 [Coniophora puteana RWD-64-598 SS2]